MLVHLISDLAHQACIRAESLTEEGIVFLEECSFRGEPQSNGVLTNCWK